MCTVATRTKVFHTVQSFILAGWVCAQIGDWESRGTGLLVDELFVLFISDVSQLGGCFTLVHASIFGK